jgi:hypothetical protein
MSFHGNYGGDPNYVNSEVVPVTTKKIPEEDNAHDHWSGRVTAFSSEVSDDDFVQPREFWQKVLARQPGQQENLIGNAASFISEVKYAEIRRQAYGRDFSLRVSTEVLLTIWLCFFLLQICSLALTLNWVSVFRRRPPKLLAALKFGVNNIGLGLFSRF